MDGLHLDGMSTPLDGATDRFTIEQTGGGFTSCPVVAPPNSTGLPQDQRPWQVPVIVVATIIGTALIVLVLLMLICYRRKCSDQKKQNGGPKNVTATAKNQDATRHAVTTITAVHQKSPEEIRMGSVRPDVIVPELHPERGSWSDNGSGVDNPGYADELTLPAERYDIDNASSIAPSDLADVVAHYRNYRNGTLRNQPIREISPVRFPVGSSAGGAVLTASRLHSPINDLTRVSPTKQVTRHSPSNILDKPALRTVTPASKRVHDSVRSTPLSGISELFPSSTTSGDSSYADRHRHHRPRSAGGQTAAVLRHTPTVGLTVDEVNRLSGSKRCTPVSALDTISSSSDRLTPNIINTTDFTHDDLVKTPVLPDSSTDDDDETNDTFTCSEFEFDNDHMRRDFTNPNRLALPPPTSRPNKFSVNAAAAHRKYKSREKLIDGLSSNSTKDDSLSAALVTSDDETSTITPRTTSGKLPTDALKMDLLNWGSNFQKLVGVFNDIAQLPEPFSNGHENGFRSHSATTGPYGHVASTSPYGHSKSASPYECNKPAIPYDQVRYAASRGISASPHGNNSSTSPYGQSKSTSPYGHSGTNNHYEHDNFTNPYRLANYGRSPENVVRIETSRSPYGHEPTTCSPQPTDYHELNFDSKPPPLRSGRTSLSPTGHSLSDGGSVYNSRPEVVRHVRSGSSPLHTTSPHRTSSSIPSPVSDLSDSQRPSKIGTVFENINEEYV